MLTTNDNDRLTCAEDIANWLAEPSDTVMPIRVMHDHIRFVGELLAELHRGPKSVDSLRSVAEEHYGLRWKTPRQVQTRLKWLQAAGLVLDVNGTKRLSEAGSGLLSDLPLERPARSFREPAPRYWLMALGPNSELWDECREEGVARLGYHEVGDIAQYEKREDIPGGKHRSLACWQFYCEMQPGDTISVKRGRTSVVGHGTVTSDYRFEAERERYQKVRDVEWLSNHPDGVKVREKQLALKTLTDVTKYPQQVEDLKKAVGILPALGTSAEASYSVDSILDDGCFLDRGELDTLLARLKSKKNLILQGPPGTGKTWLAKRLAYALFGRRDRERITAVQFHPTLSYEDFVLGWRPSAEGLKLTDGAFLRAIKAALDDPETPFVVVIEEINRGNPAQIFGELITLLEADKRSKDEAVELSLH